MSSFWHKGGGQRTGPKETQTLTRWTEEDLLKETVSKKLERYKKNQEIVEFWKPKAPYFKKVRVMTTVRFRRKLKKTQDIHKNPLDTAIRKT